MNGLVVGGQTDDLMDEWMDGWLDRPMDQWMDVGSMDGWIDEIGMSWYFQAQSQYLKFSFKDYHLND